MTKAEQFFWDFYNRWNGKGIETDPPLGFQCVALYKQYQKELGIPTWYQAIGGDGYAWQIVKRFKELGLDKYFYLNPGPAKIGDILVYTKTAETPDSHVSFFLGDVNAYQHKSWGQNQGSKDMSSNTIVLSNYGLIGVLRPKVFDEVLPASGFYDVPDDVYYAEAVKYLKEKGIITGKTDTEFKPDDLITRGQVSLIMYRMKGSPAVSYINPFADVPANHYAHKAILWASMMGITTGTGQKFRPDEACTRAEALTFIHRLAGKPLAGGISLPFKDVSKTDYFYGSVLWAYLNGYVAGVNAESFAPHKNCTRAEFATMFYRWLANKRVKVNTTPAVNIPKYGIDISEHNGNLDLSAYKDQFIIIRSNWWDTEDKQFKNFVNQCKKLNIPYGVYCYSYALNTEQAKQEAGYMHKFIKEAGADPVMGVWMDVEWDSWKAGNGWSFEKAGIIAEAFCNELKRLGYKKIGIYTGILQRNYVPSEYPLWGAHYGNNDGKINNDFSAVCCIHQYTSVPLDKNILHKYPW